MDESQPSPNDDESLPPVRWKRTLFLLTVSWALGFFVASYSSPELPVFVHAIVGFFFGIVVVGSLVRIF